MNHINGVNAASPLFGANGASGGGFEEALASAQNEGRARSGGHGARAGGASGAGGGDLGAILKQLAALLQQLQQLLESMAKDAMGGGGPSGASIAGPDGVQDAQEPGQEIPPPSQNVREVKLGNKTMKIGSDGSNASATEVDRAAAAIQSMYNSSPTFRKAIDSSPHQQLSVTLGRRPDQISWGGNGNVFLNLSNVTPGNGDAFQELTAHEFGHAASDSPHGSALNNFQRAVASEA